MKRKTVKNGLTRPEVATLARLLGKMPPVPDIPPELFVSVMQKNVPVTIDLAIVRAGKLLLTYRRDAYFKGWHFPGSFMSPGETVAEAARRTALGETDLNIRNCRLLGVFNCVRNKRFHFVSFFLLCRANGAPADGTWFSKRPRGLIPEHERLWRNVETWLRSKNPDLPLAIGETK